MKTSTEAIERDFDLDDDLDGDETLAVTPPDVVTALGFDLLDESEGELANDSRAGEGSFSVPLRNYAVGAGRAKANEAPFHGVTAWGCGHETRCRCKGGARRNGVGNCPDCRDKANEGQPCGESFIAPDRRV